MTAFKPAQPVVTPHVAPHAEPTPANMSVPTVKKVVSSKMTVGTPSKSPAPHINPPRVTPAKPVVREYAWQRRRALGKKI